MGSVVPEKTLLGKHLTLSDEDLSAFWGFESPAVHRTELLKVLPGHSGCKVLLCRRAETYFVRKISSSESYNPRLNSQIAKQSRLSKTIRTPRVLAEGFHDGLVHFDMEFVRGEDFRDRLPLTNFATLGELAERIFDTITALSMVGTGCVNPDLFHRKIETMQVAIRESPFYPVRAPQSDRAFAFLREADWTGVPRTECHGDFTLENMLVDEGGSIILIDLLDGDIETTWLDVAKLLFDLEGGWSFRKALWKDELDSGDRLIGLISSFLRDELNGRAMDLFPQLSARLPQFKIFQALRILPYVRDLQTYSKVSDIIGSYELKALA